MKINY